MVALLIVSNEKDSPFVGMISDANRAEEIVEIAGDSNTQYQFIRAGTNRAADYVVRALELMERGAGYGEESAE